MLVLIRGAGDIATGIAMRLWRAGMQVVMTDLPCLLYTSDAADEL